MTLRLLAAAVTAALALALTGCSDDTDPEPIDTRAQSERVECDRADQNEYDDDCGYWDRSGYWVLWYWVRPGHTSYSPHGWHRNYPSGASAKKPKNAKLNEKPRRQDAPASVASGGSTERRANNRSTSTRR